MNKLSGALCQSKAVGALLQHQQVRPGQQLCGGIGLLLGRSKCNAVRQVFDGLGRVEGFFKPWVMRLLRGGGLVALLPVVQQVEIVGQHPQAVGDVCPLLVRQATLGRRQGDAIDLTAKLFDLNPRQAAEKLASDFGLDPDKPPANAIALPPPKRGLTDEQWADIAYCLRVLTDYLDLLHDWRERYKPASPEEPLDERFVEALHMTETIEHLTDCVAFGTPQQKAAAASQLLSGSYLLMLEERTDRLALAKCA